MPQWLQQLAAWSTIVAGGLAVLAALWAAFRLFAPLQSINATLERIEGRLAKAEAAARRASKSARLASNQTAILKILVDAQTKTLEDIQSRSKFIRIDDPPPDPPLRQEALG